MSIAGNAFGDGGATHFDGDVVSGGAFISTVTPTSIATLGNVTYTPAQFKSGLILRDTGGALRSDVTPSAAALAAALPGADVGTSIAVAITNTSAGAFTITVTAGANVTLVGPMTVTQGTSRTFRVVFTSPSAYTLYSVS